MPKDFEQDYPSPGPQPELPAELLPTPADGSTAEPPPLANQQHIEQAEEIAQDTRIPEPEKPAVTRHLIEVSDDFDRVDKHGQTTGGRGTRERAGIADPDDEEARAVSAARKILATSIKPKPKPTRKGLSSRGRLNADGPPPWVDDSRKTY